MEIATDYDLNMGGSIGIGVEASANIGVKGLVGGQVNEVQLMNVIFFYDIFFH